jgi:hypothetical protein
MPFVMRTTFKATSFYYDLPTGTLYYHDGFSVFEYDALGQTNEIMTWKSKRVVLSEPATFGAILIESNILESPEAKQARLNEQAAIEEYNAALFNALGSMGSEIDGAPIDAFSLNGDGLKVIPRQFAFASVKIYADGVLVRTVSALDKVKRIKCQRKARVWEIQVNGTAPIEAVMLATTVRELSEIG